jgi:hypothetical protein
MGGIHDSRSRSGLGRIMVGGAVLLAIFLVASCSNGSEPNAPSGTDAADPTSSSVRVLDDCPALPCQGPLEPGKYRWTFSEPTIDFEIPSSGWTWHYSGGFRIFAEEDPTIEGLDIPDGIYFLHDPTIASRDCEDSSEPGVGRSVRDLVAWLETAPGLVVSEPTQVTVGGLEGMQLDIELDPAWKRTCFFSDGLPAVPLIFSGAALGGYHWAIVPEQSMRWFILDSEDGVIIVDIADDPGGLSHDVMLRTGTEIVDSLVFSAP